MNTSGAGGVAGVPVAPDTPGNTPGDGGKRPKRRAFTIVIVVIVVAAVIAASIGGYLYWRHTQTVARQTASAQTQSKKTTAVPKKKQSTVKPAKPAKPEISTVMMTDFQCGSSTSYSNRNHRTWKWSGSAMVSDMVGNCAESGDTASERSSSSGSGSGDGSAGEGEYSFGLWTPALPYSKVIHISMLKSGEKVESAPIVAATYGDNPAVFVVYAVKTKAVGTTPETVHLYAHEVNVDDGVLGKRIDLKTEQDNVIDLQQNYQYGVIAMSDTRIAVEKTWTTSEKITTDGYESSYNVNHVQIMALETGETGPKTLQTLQDKVEVRDGKYGQTAHKTTVQVSGAARYGIYLVRTDGDDGRSYQLYSVDDEKSVADVPGTYCGETLGCPVNTIYRVGKDHWLFDDWLVDSSGSAQSLVSLLGVDKSSSFHVDQFADGTLFVQVDEYVKGKHRVFVVSDNLKPSEVLDGDQWARLTLNSDGIEGINYLTNLIYVRTTDEQITVDTKGEAVGSYDVLPYGMDDGKSLDHTHMSWILYVQDTDAGNLFTVTRGQTPRAAASHYGSNALDDLDDE